MTARKIDLWKTVSKTEIPDKLVVDPLEVLYFDRQELHFDLFDEQDKRKLSKWTESSRAVLEKLDASLSVEQMHLYDTASNVQNQIVDIEKITSYKTGFRDGVFLMFSMIHRTGLDDGEGALSELKDRVSNLAK